MTSPEAPYRAVVDTAIDAILVIDEAGSVCAANHSAEGMFGYATTELLGRNISMLMTREHAQRHDGYMEAYRQTGDRKVIGTRRQDEGRRKNGEVFPIDLAIAEWRDSGGRRFFTGIIRDLSERDRVVAALEESQEWLRTVTDTALVGLVVIDQAHCIRFANRAYATLHNLPPQEFAGIHMRDVVPAIYDTLVKPRLEKAFTGQKTSYNEIYPPDGPASTQRNIVVTYEPGRSSSLEPVIVVVITDVTDLKRTESALRASRDLLQSVLDGAGDAIFAKDLSGRYVVVNEAAAKVIGRSREAIIGKRDDEIWPPTTAIQSINHDNNVMSGNRSVTLQRTILIDDEYRDYSSSKHPWQSAGGELRGVVGISRDVTEQNRSAAERNDLVRRLMTAEEEERLRIARELHDHLGQEVTGLSLGLKDLESKVTDEAASTRIAWLRELTDKISRELHRTAIELRPTSLQDLGLGEAIASHVTSWGEQFGIRCDMHVLELEDVPLADDVALVLYRCVQEALTNILKHAKAKNVSVVARLGDSDVRLIIEDDGVGFDMETAVMSKGGRRGLGLAGMRERMSLIGGNIDIESRVGSGTTLFLIVPMKPNEVGTR
jgi:PAS domain S-box-containing protein